MRTEHKGDGGNSQGEKASDQTSWKVRQVDMQ